MSKYTDEQTYEMKYRMKSFISHLLRVQVLIDVRLARKGEYGLEIFANDPEKEGDMFTHVCQYLCVHTDGSIEDLYGKVPGKVAEILERRAGVKEITEADLLSDADAETPETGECLHWCLVAI